ncbi:MAG: hypothetical protein ACRD1M_06830 [Terriglobales bacterium]
MPAPHATDATEPEGSTVAVTTNVLLWPEGFTAPAASPQPAAVPPAAVAAAGDPVTFVPGAGAAAGGVEPDQHCLGLRPALPLSALERALAYALHVTAGHLRGMAGSFPCEACKRAAAGVQREAWEAFLRERFGHATMGCRMCDGHGDVQYATPTYDDPEGPGRWGDCEHCDGGEVSLAHIWCCPDCQAKFTAGQMAALLQEAL